MFEIFKELATNGVTVLVLIVGCLSGYIGRGFHDNKKG